MKALAHLSFLALLAACGADAPAPAPSTLTSQTDSNAGSFQLHWDPAAQAPPLNEARP